MKYYRYVLKAGESTHIISLGDIQLPATFTIVSTDGTRNITISTTDGEYFITPSIDIVNQDFLTLTMTSPVSHVKFTGVEGDRVLVIYH